MQVGGFGFGLPHGLFAALGLAVEDMTLAPSVACDAVAGYIEPFMDPFAASLLHRLARGELNSHAALIFLRESPGAVHAFHHACEFERRGLLPERSPRLILFNLIPAEGDAAARFNRSEIDRLLAELALAGWHSGTPLAADCGSRFRELEAAQSEGRIGAADAFALRAGLAAGKAAPPIPPSVAARRDGPRIALLGAPFGNSGLHAILERGATLAVDQQGLDCTRAAQGSDADSALAAYTANPFAARQAADSYVEAVRQILREHRIDRVIWQVDRHDDLWGWLMPDVRDVARALGIAFTDLGFLPRWPTRGDLATAAGKLEVWP